MEKNEFIHDSFTKCPYIFGTYFSTGQRSINEKLIFEQILILE